MVLARPVIMYACETWPMTQGDENRLAITERKFLRKIYGPKRNKDQTYEIRSNRELQELFRKTRHNSGNTSQKTEVAWTCTKG